MADWARRVTTYDREWLDVSSDDGTRADNRTLPDPTTGKYDRPLANPGPVFDDR